MDSTAPGSESRRGFLRGVTALLGGLLTAATAAPVVGPLLAPLLRPKARASGLLLALPLKDLEVGVPRRVDLVSTKIDGWNRSQATVGAAFLLKHADGRVTALSTVCPHSGCSIHLAGPKSFSCPCHTSSFALDGKALSGPSPRAMDPLEVEVRGEDVLVRYAKYRQGVPTREEI